MAIVVRPPGSIDVIVGMNPALFNPAVHRILLRAGMYQMVMPAVRLLPAGIAIVDNDFLFTRVSVLTGMHAVFLLARRPCMRRSCCSTHRFTCRLWT